MDDCVVNTVRGAHGNYRFFCPRKRDAARIDTYSNTVVRPSVCLSVCLSVRLSVSNYDFSRDESKATEFGIMNSVGKHDDIEASYV